VTVRERKRMLLARVEKESTSLATRAASLAEREKKLAAFLDLLYGRATGSPAGTSMQQFRGILDWPVEGKVTAGFGSILDPRYRTKVPHNGVDLAVAPGAPVKAVFPGKVLYAAPFEGYGDTVIVQHPGRVFTLYAGLAGMKVGKEDMVSLGDAVGLASDKLYFEIRVENRPEDPLGWLR
jgi:septal ring factor EnvC (AmiA/AmiB activator)